MDQGNHQSNTVDSAAQTLLDSGAMDSILGDDTPEVAREPEQPEVVEQEEAEAEEIEATYDEPEAEEAEETEEVEEADEVEEVVDEDSDDSEQEQEQVSLETVDQLAEALEVDKNDLLDNLQISVTIDGQEQSVSLREAQAGYQKDADYRRKTGELAEQRRAFEAESSQLKQQVEYQHSVAAAMINHAEKNLMGELEQINYDELQQTDPMAWMAKKNALEQRKGELQRVKQEAANAYMQMQQQTQEKVAQAQQELLARELESLNAALPDFKQIKPKLDSYLTDSLGFSNQDLTGVSDHRLILLAHKAMLYDQGKQKAAKVKKVVKKAPKMQKPAKPAPTQSADRKKLTVAKKNLKKSGHIKDAASLIENML